MATDHLVLHFRRIRRSWPPGLKRAIFEYGASRANHLTFSKVTSTSTRSKTVSPDHLTLSCSLTHQIHPSHNRPASSIRKIREKGGPSTRKLIGHSGPVYSLAFDPIAGSSGPPKYLLSASADSTARLWSLDTMTNVVVYRGHQNPVWDVAWSSTGIYFATASRDKTARLWSTDRTSALRIYAGHQSDVDVGHHIPSSHLPSFYRCWFVGLTYIGVDSASGFIRTLYTWRLALVIERHGFGTFKRVHVYAYSWGIKIS